MRFSIIAVKLKIDLMSELPPTAQQADDQQKQTRHVFPFTPVKHIIGLETKKHQKKSH